MFWRILGQLFRASRGRLAVALLALASGAAVTTALINLNLDAERKVSGEFRTLGANVLILPRSTEATGSQPISRDSTVQETPLGNGDSALLPESLVTRLGALSEGNQIVSAPYLYVVAGATGEGTEGRVIVAGTWLDRTAQLAPWWKIKGQAITDRDDSHHCLVGANVARQLKISLGSRIRLGNAIRSSHSFGNPYSQASLIPADRRRPSHHQSRRCSGTRSAARPIGLVQISIPGTRTEISHAIARFPPPFRT